MERWKGAWKLIRSRPLFGWGIGTFPLEQTRTVPGGVPRDLLLQAGPSLAEEAHNEYLQIAAELGLVGLSLYLWVLGAFFRTGIRALKERETGLRKLVLLGCLGGVAGQVKLRLEPARVELLPGQCARFRLFATVDDPFLLVRHSAGQLIPVVVPGQDMPGGGKLRRIQDFGISFANDLGQHAFLATLTDGRSAAYLLEPNGDLSLLLVSGTTTPRGVLDSIGYGGGLSTGIALNNKGQIATTVQLDGGVDTVALFSISP